MKKMQALQNMIKNSQPNAEADDVELDDEFDSYMEASLMQDSENPFKGLDGQAAGLAPLHSCVGRAELVARRMLFRASLRACSLWQQGLTIS